jgi:hypothetical protein
MLKTIAVSKIKEVKSVSEPYGKYQTIYHKLIMENGDKIDIGKKKKLEVGEELNYEITEEGQHPFNKAKSVWEDKSNNFSGGYKKDDSVQKLIVRQSSLKSAVDSCKGENHNHILKVAQIYVDWVMEDKMPDENDERPF